MLHSQPKKSSIWLAGLNMLQSLMQVPERVGQLTCVCKCSSSVHMSGGNMSCRVAAHWPHLMNAGPAASSARLPFLTNSHAVVHAAAGSLLRCSKPKTRCVLHPRLT